MTSPIASGSFLTAGMVICPCSGSTLGAVVHGTGENLIHRAAEVHLKERRPLIVVPRETPLSSIQLENMRRAAEARRGRAAGHAGLLSRRRVDSATWSISSWPGSAINWASRTTLMHRWGT